MDNQFDHTKEDHLSWALKLAFRNLLGDLNAGTDEATNALCDALCNHIGDEAFHEFMKTFDVY